MKKTYFKNLLTVGLLAVSLTACKKEGVKIDLDQTAAQDNAQAQYVFTDLGNIVDDASRSQGGVNKMQAGNTTLDCATFTKDSALYNGKYFTSKLTITYDSTCTSATGSRRSGKIVITYSKPYNVEGSDIDATLVGYKFNGYTITGWVSKLTTTTGSTMMVDGEIKASSGKKIYFISDWIQTRTSDGGTPKDASDDAFTISGSGNGVSTDGKKFSITMTTPLTIDRSQCKYITKGIVELTPEGLDKRVLDFGDGTCDDIAKATFGGNTYTLHMNK